MYNLYLGNELETQFAALKIFMDEFMKSIYTRFKKPFSDRYPRVFENM